MKKIEIFNLEIERLENPGCNNGNYPRWRGQDEHGNNIGGVTCRCTRGCSGTDRLALEDGRDYLIIYDWDEEQ